MAIDFQEAKTKIETVRRILSKLDHVVTLRLNPQVYTNGNVTIEMSTSDRTKLESEYDEIMDELEIAIDEIPED